MSARLLVIAKDMIDIGRWSCDPIAKDLVSQADSHVLSLTAEAALLCDVRSALGEVQTIVYIDGWNATLDADEADWLRSRLSNAAARGCLTVAGSRPPAEPAEPSAADEAGTASARLFQLHRDEDVSGISGTGVVADGVVFPDGVAVVRWRGERASTVVWPSIVDVEAIHGHGGATRVVWTATA